MRMFDESALQFTTPILTQTEYEALEPSKKLQYQVNRRQDTEAQLEVYKLRVQILEQKLRDIRNIVGA